jgi:hypothetical protein
MRRGWDYTIRGDAQWNEGGCRSTEEIFADIAHFMVTDWSSRPSYGLLVIEPEQQILEQSRQDTRGKANEIPQNSNFGGFVGFHLSERMRQPRRP